MVLLATFKKGTGKFLFSVFQLILGVYWPCVKRCWERFLSACRHVLFVHVCVMMVRGTALLPECYFVLSSGWGLLSLTTCNIGAGYIWWTVRPWSSACYSVIKHAVWTTHRIVCCVSSCMSCWEKSYVWNRWNNCEFFQHLWGLHCRWWGSLIHDYKHHIGHWLTRFRTAWNADTACLSYLFITYCRSPQIFSKM